MQSPSGAVGDVTTAGGPPDSSRLGRHLRAAVRVGAGLGGVLAWMLCVVASDVGGYAAGVTLGRHPMAPTISPKKSWEGFAGSMLAGMAAGAICVAKLLGGAWWLGVPLGALLVGTATA